MNKSTSNNYLVALSIVGILFFSIGFALGINGLLIPYLQKAFNLSSTGSYLVLTATFGAFVICGYPAGWVIKKIGYKKGMMVSFLFFAIGLYMFIPSAKFESFVFFLVASFVSGIGNTILQAAVNPYVTICGPMETAAKRISIMGILNKCGWAIAPIFLSLFLDLSQTTIKLSDMYLPFYIIVGVFILLAIVVWFVPLPEIKATGEDESDVSSESKEVAAFVNTKKNIFQFPHLILGVITLFFYVGVETIALATVVDFANTISLPNPERYTSYTVLAMVIGYALGALLIPKIISQTFALKFCTTLGIICSLLVIIFPVNLAIYFVALMGFANSLIWGPVWPLAIAYLGRFTKAGASLLVIAIVGGAIIPLLFAILKDTLGNMQQAYWICFPLYVYMAFYAFKGHKIGLKSIIKTQA